jgi:hypothetical protein
MKSEKLAVEGGGVCGRSARGRTNPHRATRGTGKKEPLRSKKRNDHAPTGQNKRVSRSEKEEADRSAPAGQRKTSTQWNERRRPRTRLAKQSLTQ